MAKVPRPIRFEMRLSKEEYKLLKLFAALEDRSVANYIRQLLRRADEERRAYLRKP